jgi:hypothetical protein
VAVIVSNIGVVLAIIGAVLLYMFSDPRFGDGIMLETYNARRQRIGARAGLACLIVGTVLQAVAVRLA